MKTANLEVLGHLIVAIWIMIKTKTSRRRIQISLKNRIIEVKLKLYMFQS